MLLGDRGAEKDPIAELIELFARLPGIGERTAARLAFFVLAKEPHFAVALGKSLETIHERVKRCSVCGNFGAKEKCAVCLDLKRDPRSLCVVARVPDLVALERSGYRGRYHVLHGLIAPLDGVGPDSLPFDLLKSRCLDGMEEVIVATPLNVEGEATALYISEILRDVDGLKVTRIASGVPHGGELEFTDQVTLGRALDGRKNI